MIDKGANDWNDGVDRAGHGQFKNVIDLMIYKGATHTCDYGLCRYI